MLCRLLLKDEKGLLSKESARSVIDGSVFQKLAEEREKRLQRRRVNIYKHTSAAVHCEQQHAHVCMTPSIDPGIGAMDGVWVPPLSVASCAAAPAMCRHAGRGAPQLPEAALRDGLAGFHTRSNGW